MKAIIFDLDDTLVVEEASAEAAFFATCSFAEQKSGVNPQRLHTHIRKCCREFWQNSPARPYCLNVGISSWEGLWAEFSGDDKNLRILSEWASTYRRISWQEALRRCGITDDGLLARELGYKYIQERRKRHVVYDDVLPVLKHFKQCYKLGLLTNGSPDLQRTKLEGSGLAAFFDAIVISGDVGYGKPDEKIFKLILSQLCTPPESTVMIGNSLKSDVLPALGIGMIAVWVNRDGKAGKESITPNAEVTDLRALKEIFEEDSVQDGLKSHK